MYKRILSMFIVFALVLSLCACFNKTTLTPSYSENESSTENFFEPTTEPTTESTTEPATDKNGYYEIEYELYQGKTVNYWDGFEVFADKPKIKLTAKIPWNWYFADGVGHYPSEPYEMKFDFCVIIDMENEDEFLNNYAPRNSDSGEAHKMLDKGSYDSNGYKIIYANSESGGHLFQYYLVFDGTKAVILYFWIFRDLSSTDQKIINNIVESIRF